MSTATPMVIDLHSRQFFDDPYPAYEALLDRGVFFADGTWLVARHADAMAIFKDPRISKRLPSARRLVPLSMTAAFLDPPDHTRLRGVVQQAFTPTAIRRLEERMGCIADNLIDEFRHERRINFHARFATRFPVTVIAEMLEVPIENLAELHRRASRYTAATDVSRFPGWAGLRQMRTIQSLHDYFRRIVMLRRQKPLGGILTSMIAALDEGQIDEPELVDTCALLLVAGSDTTTNLFGTGLLTLIKHPEQMELLRRDPQLLEGAIEEMLRYESPLQRATYRVTTAPVEVADVVIPQGQRVAPVVGAANRDPREFPDPHRFNILRTPNRHVAFGYGIHACIGAALARSEARIGFGRLLEAFPRMRLGCPAEALRWRRNVTMRGVTTLPVEL